MRDLLLGPLLRSVRHVWPSDWLLWPAARFALRTRRDSERLVLRKTADNFRIPLRVRFYPDGAMYFGVFELQTVRLMHRLLQAGDCAIDVGANIGYMALHMARAVGPRGRVHCFEPLPANCERARRAITENGVSNIVLHPNAVGAASSQAHVYSFGDASHALSSMAPLRDDAERVECQVVSLDDTIHEPIRLIKIDVEGAEVGVLRGAARILRTHRPHVIVENNADTLRAFGHTFADVVGAARAAYAGYEAILLDARMTALDEYAIRNGRVPNGNVWLRPTSI